jgi:hypothetical protein
MVPVHIEIAAAAAVESLEQIRQNVGQRHVAGGVGGQDRSCGHERGRKIQPFHRSGTADQRKVVRACGSKDE